MPEAYIHVSVATKANNKIHRNINNMNVYLWGSQGPDPMYCYKFFDKNKEYNLNEMASILHEEKCGLFLQDLIINAKNDIQKDFASGFAMHYVADTVMHPYIVSQSSENGRFNIPYGHGFCEVSLDSYIHQLEKATMTVKGKEVAPQLSDDEYMQIAQLLQKSLKNIYDYEVPAKEIVSAYKSSKYYHTYWFGTSNKLLILLIKFVEKYIVRKPGVLMCHVTPCPQPKNGYISEWVNPFTNKLEHTSPLDLVHISVEKGTALLKAITDFYSDKISEEQIRHIIGNKSFLTGLEIE